MPNNDKPIYEPKQLDPLVLAQFTGTERWYRHSLARNVTYNDGVSYVADNAGAYWQVDIIALAHGLDDKVRKEPFQHWKLLLKEDQSADVICGDGNGSELLSAHHLD